MRYKNVLVESRFRSVDVRTFGGDKSGKSKPEDLVCRLAEVRAAAGLTRTELADLVKTSRQQIHRLEQAKQAPTLPLALRLSRVLDVAIEHLWYIPSYDGLEPLAQEPGTRRLIVGG